MSEELKEKTTEETGEKAPSVKKITSMRGMASPNKRKNAKKIDVTKTAKLFDKEFYVHLVDPEMPDDEFNALIDDDGVLDMQGVPDKYIVEFKCCHIDPGTMTELINTAISIDADPVPSGNEVAVVKEPPPTQAAPAREYDFRQDFMLRCEVVYRCTKEPDFESAEQVKKVLLPVFITELFTVITEGAYGGNIRYRFPKGDRK